MRQRALSRCPRLWFPALCLAVLTGCATHHINQPLLSTSGATNSGYYFHTRVLTNNSDDLMVVLTFSGGGTRAASLS
jgi:NTE family protein